MYAPGQYILHLEKVNLEFVEKSLFLIGTVKWEICIVREKKNYKVITIYLIAGQTLDNHTEQL